LYLLAAGKEEFIWVNAVGDSAANEGHPVEDYRRLCRVLEKKLPQYIDHDGKKYEGCDAGCDEARSRCICDCIGERASNLSENPHFDRVGGGESRGRGRREEVGKR
jgi:hypothetical protein